MDHGNSPFSQPERTRCESIVNGLCFADRSGELPDVFLVSNQKTYLPFSPNKVHLLLFKESHVDS